MKLRAMMVVFMMLFAAGLVAAVPAFAGCGSCGMGGEHSSKAASDAGCAMPCCAVKGE